MRRTVKTCSATRLFALLVGLTLISQFSLAQVPSRKHEIIRRARQSYYGLRQRGLRQFRASIQPNWETVTKGAPSNSDAMRMLNGLNYSMTLRPDGHVEVVHEPTVPIPRDQMANVKRISDGLDQMLNGFFSTWNLFMLDTPFPAVESEFELEDVGGRYLLSYKEGDTNVSTTMTKELEILQIEIQSPKLRASVKPVLSKTDGGYILLGYQATYDPIDGTGKSSLNVQLDYQDVDGLQLPRRFNLNAIYDGTPAQVELLFTKYQVELANSAPAPK